MDAALRTLHELQRQVGLRAVDEPIQLFWDRRYRGVRDVVVTELEDLITDPQSAPCRAGSVRPSNGATTSTSWSIPPGGATHPTTGTSPV